MNVMIRILFLGVGSGGALGCSNVESLDGGHPFVQRIKNLELSISQPKQNSSSGMRFAVKLSNPENIELCVVHTPGVILSAPSSGMVLKGDLPSHGGLPSGVVQTPLKLRPIEARDGNNHEVNVTVIYPYKAYFAKRTTFHEWYKPGDQLVAKAYWEISDCKYENQTDAISAGASTVLFSDMTSPFAAESDMFQKK
ncbi:hypothetical protein [Aliiroseovarius crassostreae]|uniref:hypothetical protein n=1 Tax=Aliiroseovarius crassostreae TaxID=154981 RepID=UPI00220C1816|nr:hypothetical protein [Aliiroseovarius crassostreae]UWP99360.1 hypothetical protein K3X53_04210 [Aliiroseovarius crassostreae]